MEREIVLIQVIKDTNQYKKNEQISCWSLERQKAIKKRKLFCLKTKMIPWTIREKLIE